MPRRLKDLGVDGGQRFIFATGIENSYPVIRGRDGRPKRIDQMEKCRHYEMWREDFRLVREVDWDCGLRYERNRVNPPGLYDLGRKIRPVGEAFKKSVAEWRGILPVESRSLNLDTLLAA